MKLFPYTYVPENRIEVYEKTKEYLTTNPDLKRRIEELGWIYLTVGDIIPQNTINYWSGHHFPYIESWEEMQISFNQACLGFYKQAFVSLRSGLELGLLSVYFNINDEGHITVKEWLNSKNTNEAATPRADKIWKILLSNENIKQFNQKHDLRATYNSLGFLHNYVHTKGAKFSNRMGLLKSNTQTFDAGLINEWLNTYADIISLVSTLHLLKYPISVIRYDYHRKFGIDKPNFGNLDGSAIDNIASILPDNYLSDIEEIALKDNRTQSILKELNSMPDITEKQIEEQIINLEKIFIEDGEGFTMWLEKQKEILTLTNQPDFDTKQKERIELLRQWATENGFMESKAKRLGWEL